MEKQLITDLLALALTAEKSKSAKKVQSAKMKAGKIRRQLAELNKDTSVKIDN